MACQQAAAGRPLKAFDPRAIRDGQMVLRISAKRAPVLANCWVSISASFLSSAVDRRVRWTAAWALGLNPGAYALDVVADNCAGRENR
jgi:hypothetical protein